MYNIASKIRKLEKHFNISITKEKFLSLLGMPVSFIEEDIPSEEQEAIIQKTVDNYTNKIAKELNISKEKAQQLFDRFDMPHLVITDEYVI